MFGRKRQIPEIFYDTIEEKPIATCTGCGKNLVEGEEPYVIEKAFRRKEVVFEYALCMPCMEKMRGQMSKESMANVEKYMLENANFQERAEELQAEDFDIDKWLSRCVVKNEERSDLEEYQIQGMFAGDKMLEGQFPIMIGGHALEEIQELISAETRDELDRFRNDFFDLPPELEEIFRDKPILVV